MSIQKIEKLISKNGLPILQVESSGNLIPMHSKYDPVKEADRILDSYKEEIEKYDHVLFYGLGMGYHVTRFFERYPNKIASVYEPFKDVFNECTASAQITKLPVECLEHVFVGEEDSEINRNLTTLSQSLHRKILLILLPVYEKIAAEHLEHFQIHFRTVMQEKLLNTHVEMNFSKRWTLNALMNLKSVLDTPNILFTTENPFRNKPVVIASAGPSLHEEMENLRRVKEKGRAYIFAVGSANKALISNNIYPDAVLTYDPQSHNHTVFSEMIQENIDETVPMIFGTTVGHETVSLYKGPKIHFLTSQDSITNHFVDNMSPFLNDSRSIAVVALQLLQKLGAEKIILVGQNFAFKNDLFYSEEIQRFDDETKEMTSAHLQKKDLLHSYLTTDTLGGQVMTNNSFDSMRQEMEHYIEQYPHVPVINTTNGGAAIKGTEYRPLSEVIQNELTDQSINQAWHLELKNNSSFFSVSRFEKLQRDVPLFFEQSYAVMNHLDKMNRALAQMKKSQIKTYLEKFDQLFQKMVQNSLFTIVLRPITRVFFERLQAETKVIRLMEPSQEKAARVVNAYQFYVNECLDVYKDIAPVLQTIVFPGVLPYTGWKEYTATSGAFHFEGEWEKHLYEEKEEEPDLKQGKELDPEQVDETDEEEKKEPEIRIQSVASKQGRAKIKFRFSGAKLALYGKNQSDEPLKLRLMIDNKTTTLKVEKNTDEKLQCVMMRNLLYTTADLVDGMHSVTIELLSENPDFLFQAAEIDQNERLYHFYEVTSVEQLQIGKRIRCHYNASLDNFGDFSGLGDETSNFLFLESAGEPSGDFYLIKVSEDPELFIADRVVQHSISYDTLEKRLHSYVELGNSISLYIRLLNISSTNNEWHRYLLSSTLNNTVRPNDELVWNHERNANTNQGDYFFITYGLSSIGICAKYTNINQNIIGIPVEGEYDKNESSGFRPLFEINKLQ